MNNKKKDLSPCFLDFKIAPPCCVIPFYTGVVSLAPFLSFNQRVSLYYNYKENAGIPLNSLWLAIVG